MKRFITAVVLFLAGYVATVFADTPSTTLSDGRTGTITFRVPSGQSDMWTLVTGAYVTNNTIWGYLRMPESTSGTVPAMVISHGSGGLQALSYAWAQLFETMGVATFVIDHFSGRGVTSTSANQSLVYSSVIPADGLMALRLLATHPRIDTNRIGYSGFSKGGGGALVSAYERLRAAIVPESSLRFALHIPFYPGGRFRADSLTGAPIRIFLSDLDDYEPWESTQSLVNYLKAVGGDVEMTLYSNAYHAFDSAYPPTWLADAANAKNCPTSLNIDTFSVINPISNTSIAGVSASNLSAYLTACTTYGTNVGKNESARSQSRQAVWSFVKQEFRLTGIPDTVTLPNDTERILNWAEFKYSSLLGNRTSMQQGSGYTYRCYTANNTCAGTGDSTVYYYDGIKIMAVGTTQEFLDSAAADGM